MSATNFTPIQLYRTSTAAAVPTAGNLAAGELAINLTDERLYFKNAAGVVKLLASNSGALGTVTSVDVSGGTTGLTTSGGPITSSGTITLAGTLGVANGGTGTTTAFTAGSVVFAGASGVYSQDNANLFWDNANDRLGIGTSSPAYRLDVNGAINVAAGQYIRSGSAFLMASTGSNLNYNYTGSTALIWRNGADTAELMRLENGGNVGIGTSSPVGRLDAASASATGNIINARNTSSSQFFIGGVGLQNGATANNSGVTIGTGVRDADGTDSFFTINKTTSAGSYVAELAYYDLSADFWKLSTSNAERMRIDSSGNVGIGTTSPGSKLDVRGVITGGDGTIQTVISYLAAAGVTGTLSNHPYVLYANNAERMRIDSSGNVGIGLTPSVKFQVAGTARVNQPSATRYRSDWYLESGNAYMNGFDDTGGVYIPLSLNFSSYTFNSGASERMRIDSGGNVGIGTTSPGAKLDVTGPDNSGGAGILVYSANRTANLQLAFNTLATSANSGGMFLSAGGATPIVFNTNGTERARIDASGNLLVGTTSVSNLSTGAASNPGFGVAAGQVRSQWNADANAYWSKVNVSSSTVLHDFYVAGTRVGVITTNGSTTTYGTSSDVRLKDNIADADNASSLIDAIQVRKFDWKADGSHQRYGFVAQELLEVAPEAVTNLLDPEEMMGVDYSKLVPMLVKEIQSMRARLAQLEGN